MATCLSRRMYVSLNKVLWHPRYARLLLREPVPNIRARREATTLSTWDRSQCHASCRFHRQTRATKPTHARAKDISTDPPETSTRRRSMNKKEGPREYSGE